MRDKATNIYPHLLNKAKSDGLMSFLYPCDILNSRLWF